MKIPADHACVMAAAAGDLDELCRQIRLDASINTQDARGDTPLHAATRKNQLHIISFLLANHAQLLPNGDGYNALQEAAEHASLEAFEIIAKHIGLIPEFYTQKGLSLLQLAISNPEPAIFRKLLHLPNQQKLPALITAASRGLPQHLLEIIQTGIPPDQALPRSGNNALLAAAKGSYPHGQYLLCLQILLDHGAKPNHLDASGYSPLLHAVKTQSADRVLLLLKYGAHPQPEPSSPTGETPLNQALRPSIISALIKAGADPNQTSPKLNGISPLIHACSQIHTGIALNAATQLLKLGANPNLATRGSGITPLHAAAEKGHAALVSTLIDAGANPRTKNAEGKSPGQLAHNSLVKMQLPLQSK